MFGDYLIIILGLTDSYIRHSKATDLQYLNPEILQTKTSTIVQKQEAMNIIRKYSDDVNVEVTGLFIDNKDTFQLITGESKLNIYASTGVAAVWGFNYYLKKYCNSHIGWQVKRINIPNPLPKANETVTASDRFRYYQNVHTFSYSFVWWNLTKWDKHVDWMALNGINLALAPIDQEAIWTKIYKDVGMTDEEMNKHFTGPAFVSWLRMGNFHGWGGPLQKSWHDRQSNIQDYVLEKMFNLGMIPVLPAFNGHVPSAFSRIYPRVSYLKIHSWYNFPQEFCCDLYLDPSDPYFKTLGAIFLNELFRITTTSHIYYSDPFNELHVDKMSEKFVSDASKSIFSIISEADKRGVWLVQNWMFINDGWWAKNNRAKDFLTSVPLGRMLVLDMQSEQSPKYDTFEMYYGQPFIWCMLHNFGGTLGMIGKIPTVNKIVHEARSKLNNTMIGIGLTPEGINQNYVVYDLMLEAGWRREPVNLENWIEHYAYRRYGCNETSSAWKILLHSVYSYNNNEDYGYNQYRLTQSPTLEKPGYNWWYKIKDLLKALRIFISAPKRCNSPGFLHDMVDLTRQLLQHKADLIYSNELKNWKKMNVTAFNASIHLYFNVLHDIEKILATNDDFTTGEWLEDVKSFAESKKEFKHYMFNARKQITQWGPVGTDIVKDKATKQWAEIFHYYYIPRWTKYLTTALEAKRKNLDFNSDQCLKEIEKEIEKPFIKIRINQLPKGNTRKLAAALYKKWIRIGI